MLILLTTAIITGCEGKEVKSEEVFDSSTLDTLSRISVKGFSDDDIKQLKLIKILKYDETSNYYFRPTHIEYHNNLLYVLDSNDNNILLFDNMYNEISNNINPFIDKDDYVFDMDIDEHGSIYVIGEDNIYIIHETDVSIYKNIYYLKSVAVLGNLLYSLNINGVFNSIEYAMDIYDCEMKYLKSIGNNLFIIDNNIVGNLFYISKGMGYVCIASDKYAKMGLVNAADGSTDIIGLGDIESFKEREQVNIKNAGKSSRFYPTIRGTDIFNNNIYIQTQTLDNIYILEINNSKITKTYSYNMNIKFGLFGLEISNFNNVIQYNIIVISNHQFYIYVFEAD